MSTLPEMLQKTIQAGASDLHLTTGVPAQIRVDGKLRAIDQQAAECGGHQKTRIQRDD